MRRELCKLTPSSSLFLLPSLRAGLLTDSSLDWDSEPAEIHQSLLSLAEEPSSCPNEGEPSLL